MAHEILGDCRVRHLCKTVIEVQTVLNVVLSHQPPADVDRLATYWESLLENGDVVVAYGGPHESFGHIQFQKKLFIDDSSLRTLDHQREGQSYTAVFREVSLWLQNSSKQVDFVTLFEFDHVPLAADLNARQVERLRTERADVVAHHLARVDATSHPHYLYYAANREFARFAESVLGNAGLVSDARFATGPARDANRNALRSEIENVFSTLTGAQVIERLEQAQIANARLNTMQEFWDHEQLEARERWREVASPGGPVRAMKPPFNLDSFEPRMDEIPALGAHTRAILAELGFASDEIERLREQQAIG